MMKKKKSLTKQLFIWLISLAALGLIPAAILFNNLQIEIAEEQEVAKYSSANTTDQTKESSQTALTPLVSVISVQAHNYPAMISAFGEAKARHKLALNSVVSGQVTWISPQFETGEIISKGTTLVKLSKRNYLPALATAKQNLASAQHALASTDQALAAAYENVASAEQKLAAAYQEQADAQLALKQEIQQAKLAQQSFDKTDQVASAQAEVTAAVLALKEEKRQQQLAKQDWKLAGIKGSPSELANRQPQIAAANARLHAAKLALQRAQYNLKQKNTELEQRKPQIAAAKARLNAANLSIASAKKSVIANQKQVAVTKQQINVNKAQLESAKQQLNKAKEDLIQTTIKAPFNAVVTNRTITQGSYVSVGQSMGQLQSNDVTEIKLALSNQQWQWLPEQENATVNLYDSQQLDKTWQGHIVRTAQFINQQTRTRDVTVQVKKPLQQNYPLLVGTFVKATIQGKTITNVLKVPSSALAADGAIWLVNTNNELERLNANILFSKDNQLYITAPSHDDHFKIVRWPLVSYLSGMKVTPHVDTQTANQANQGDAS